MDGSDEFNCTTDEIHFTNSSISPVECDHPSRFCDNNTRCISVDKLCNDHQDCADGSDEGSQCEIKPCEHSFKCPYICHDAPDGVVCSCPPHLHLQHDKINCLESHPCEAWGVCAHKCIRHGTRYKCECNSEYNIDADGFTCKSVNNATPYVIFSSRFDLRAVDLHTFNVKSLITSLKNTVALDFYHTDDTDMVCYNFFTSSKFRSYAFKLILN